MSCSEIEVGLSLPSINIGGWQTPGFSLKGKWKPNDDERKAAWQLYVELVTRVPVAELPADEGVLREALSSLHAVFGITRGILKEYGPKIATPRKKDALSFGYIAVAVLNRTLRPVLAKWHPMLLQHEALRAQGVDPVKHEKAWQHEKELRQQLSHLRGLLLQYCSLLEEVAGVPSLVVERG